MEILVLVILALFIIAVVLLVVIYVNVRRISVVKRFNSELSKLDDDDMDDEDDYPSLVLPINIKELQKNDEAVIEDKEKIIENEVIEEEKENSSEMLAEMVNILINKKSYILLANNNKVKRDEHIRVRIDDEIHQATVIKANYMRDISKFKVKPKKLIIVKNDYKKKKNKNTTEEKTIIEKEFIPKKKVLERED